MPTSAADPTSGTPSQTAKPRRRWYQFTLRTAGVWIALLCLLLGSFAWWRDRAVRQRKVVEELRGLGARVDYRYFSQSKWKYIATVDKPQNEFFLCSWLRHYFGTDFVYDVDSVRVRTSPGLSIIQPESLRLALPLIQKCPRIRLLELEGSEVSGADLRNLPCLESLEELTLSPASRSVGSHGVLTDGDLVFLERATHLRLLDLANQPVGDTGLKHLGNCPGLQVLRLRDTNIGDEGLKHLSELTELVRLDLSHTRISDAGLKYLCNLKQLEELTLRENAISGEGLAYVGPKPELNFLDAGNTEFTDDALRHLKQFPKLDAVDLTNTKITGSGIPHLSRLKLRGVCLNGCAVSDAGIAGIEIPDSWRFFSVARTTVSDKGFCSLKLPPSMEMVLLADTGVTDASLYHLQFLPNLKCVSVSKTQITREGIQRFLALNPNCKVVD